MGKRNFLPLYFLSKAEFVNAISHLEFQITRELKHYGQLYISENVNVNRCAVPFLEEIVHCMCVTSFLSETEQTDYTFKT